MSRVRAGAWVMAAMSLAAPATLYAQQSVSVSITPPLIQLTIGPGESWSSALKVINNNAYDQTYYATVVDFAAQGEDGTGTFIPLVSSTDSIPSSYSLASWTTLEKGPIVIPAGRSGEVPFTVHVPDLAEPGGHYAAILVGTDPGGAQLNGPTMRVSSYVSSLVLVRIRGEATESGRIREFSTLKSIAPTANADFVLRFENTGNTHLRPQGDITIYNMWGKKRGELSVNQDEGNFGNVLPQSTRKFSFTWSGDTDLLDIGRYSAVATLTFGEAGKRNISAVTYFWVVPAKPVAATLGTLLVFVLILTWLIRRYIRRALVLERERLGLSADTPVPVQTPAMEVFMEPIREGVIDLRRVAGSPSDAVGTAPVRDRLTLAAFFKKYALFFVFIILVAAGGLGAWSYLHRVLVSSRNFQITDVSIQQEQGSVPGK
jgi:hypothetical protein